MIKFDFDFSFFDEKDLIENCITFDEIENVFYGNSKIKDYFQEDGFGYCIGFSYKNKFISFTFDFKGEKVRPILIYLSYEEEIRNRYFSEG